MAFRLFPVFDGPVGLLLIDLFEGAQVLQLDKFHVGVVLLRRDLTIDVALLHQGLDFPVGFLLFLDGELVGLLLLLALGLAVLRLDGQALRCAEVSVGKALLLELDGYLQHPVGVVLVVLLARGVGDAVQGFLTFSPLLLGLEPVFGLAFVGCCGGSGFVAATGTIAATWGRCVVGGAAAGASIVQL